VATSEEPLWQCTGGTVFGMERMSLPCAAANKPVVLPKMGKVCMCYVFHLTSKLGTYLWDSKTLTLYQTMLHFVALL